MLREGRITTGQKRALQTLWPKFGIENNAHIDDLDSLFASDNPKVLEIGFGMGESLAKMAQDSPQTDFIGIEVHRPGVGSLLTEIEKHSLRNLKVMHGDAAEILERVLPDNAFDRIQIFFPDPWHKKRHKKRRIIQEQFVLLLAKKLKANGILHLATDWEDYALHMSMVLANCRAYRNTVKNQGFPKRPDYRPITKFERRGKGLGHDVWDLIYRLN